MYSLDDPSSKWLIKRDLDSPSLKELPLLVNATLANSNRESLVLREYIITV